MQARRKEANPFSASGASRLERPEQINTKRDPATPPKIVRTGYAKPGVSATSKASVITSPSRCFLSFFVPWTAHFSAALL